jgi:O-antigen/teichoic acid export membrane protein
MNHLLPTIASNTLAQLVSKFFGAGLTFVITVLIIRLASPTVFGDLTKSLVLIGLGFTLADFGLNAITVRALGQGKALTKEFSTLLYTRLSLSLLTLFILNLALFFLPDAYSLSIRGAFFLGSLALIFQGVYTTSNAVFQHQQNYWLSTISTVLGTTVSAGLTYYYLLTSPTLSHFLLATTIGYFVMALISLGLVGIKPVPVQQKDVLNLLKAAAPLGAILVSSVAGSKLDTLVLGSYWPSSVVGEYGFAYRIFDVLLVVPVFLTNALYPHLVRVNKNTDLRFFKTGLGAMFLAGLVLTLITYLAAPLLDVIRPGLNDSIRSLKLLSLGLPFFFTTAPLMWYLIAQSYEKTVLSIYLLATAFNLISNLIFVPSYGLAASAIITGATELFIFLSLLYHSFSLKNQYKRF